ncbi:hypothetical protein EW026_g1395 [Hermanssonia centrifuga]|uniref:Aldehyde dehydrogenase n=1 Tax=Hermanssonia centrifuga TaxID=98765 RepID=A0A4V3XBA4_9APHY|nr:hypothetical protein EW026_g1395 [Hermanssonia centrifuga]
MTTQNTPYTSPSEIKQIHANLVKGFKSGITRPLSYRRHQLLQLARLVQENIPALEDAVLADLGKQRQECTLAELGPIVQACLYAAENLEEWAKPKKPQVEEFRKTWDVTIYSVPKGVVLIISPWNFPYILTLGPLVGAIAAGCPAVLKPSESTPTCSAFMAALIAKYLDPAAYTVVLGAVEESTTLLELQWNHIFFTGGTSIGRKIAAAAGKNLTPLTLELGGMNPAIIDTDCDLELAAKRLLFGQIQNAGQLCVAPDYVLIPRSIATLFKDAVKKAYEGFFPSDPLHPESNWSKIVNVAHFNRLESLLARTRGEIILGGKVDENLRIAPTVVTNVKLDDPLMEEEIFGPILPIIEVENTEEAVQIVGDRPSPLVVYVFTDSEDLKQKFLDRTNSGTLVLNDTFMQLSVYEMPFGGHGDSGYGAYLGKRSFDTFTHERSYINIPAAMEPFFGYRYLPYTDESYKVMTAQAFAEIPEA